MQMLSQDFSDVMDNKVVTVGKVGPGYQPGCIILRVGNLED
jgi:hypothetical protein